MPFRSSSCSPPGQHDQGARLAAPAMVSQVGGARSRLYLDPGYRFVASFFPLSGAFFGGDANDSLPELVKGSMAASVDCLIAHTFFPAQAVGAFCREHVDNGCPFAGLVAICVPTFVDCFCSCGAADAHQCGQHQSLMHGPAPSLGWRSVA